MFVDECTVKLAAGDGGRGCVSFRREKYEPWGGPNGGDGGRGGDVVLVGDHDTNNLVDYKYQPHWRAERGEHGLGSDQHGRDGGSCRLRLPLGTVVIDEGTGKVVAEVVGDGVEIVLCKGGNGGWGNTHFRSSTHQAPKRANPGHPGETGTYRLILKSIADIGLVGFPNAGKSSLTNAITKARPKTAAYPFTTLHPQIGVIEYPHERRLLLADVPGLIEGASENRGLGHRFLRHIERCALLLILIDMAGTGLIASQLLPMGPDRTKVIAHYLFVAEDLVRDDFDPSPVVDFSELVARQDFEVAERVQRGVSSSAFGQGVFAVKDEAVDVFVQRYLEARDGAS